MFIIDLLSDTNGECKISDESIFLRNIGQKMLHYMEVEDEFHQYDQIQLLILRIYENIQQSIQMLESLKLAEYKDEVAVTTREDSLESMLWILNNILTNLNDPEKFVFPYFDQLLEVAYNPMILNQLTYLVLHMLSSMKADPIANASILDSISFYKPFARLYSHFKGDYQLLADTAKEALKKEGKPDRLSEALDNLLLVIFDNQKKLVEIVKEQYIGKDMENKNAFVSRVFKIITKKYDIIKHSNKQRYYSTLGQVVLATFFMDNLDEKVFALIFLAKNLESKHSICINLMDF